MNRAEILALIGTFVSLAISCLMFVLTVYDRKHAESLFKKIEQNGSNERSSKRSLT
jgi:hypothetical protein